MFDANDEKTQPWFYDIKDFALKFRASLLKGEKKCCPTCGRYSQMYARPLNSAMCRQLLILLAIHRRGTDAKPGWVHVRAVILPGTSGAGDFSKLKHWQLIEPKDAAAADDDQKATGYWRLTAAGIRFATGQIALHPVAMLLNDVLVRFEGDPVKIHTALGKKFNYAELIGDSNGNTKTA